MYVHDFRVMIWILYVPGLFIFVYFWLVPESFRWLFRTGHFDRAVNILKQNARINNKVLTTKSIEILHMKYSTDSLSKYDDHNKSNEESLTQSLYLIFKSKVLCLRFLNGCYQWIACVMCYYGLSISSVHIPGADRYISFIFVMAVEIPAVLLAQPLLSRMKRRPLLFATFAIAGISVISTRFIPDDYSIIEVGLLSLGKASVSIAFAGLYIFTAEQWPTNIRNTSVSCCSMAGRIGSMAAPFAVILFVRHNNKFVIVCSSFIKICLVFFSGYSNAIIFSFTLWNFQYYCGVLCTREPRNVIEKIARHNRRGHQFISIVCHPEVKKILI